MSTPSRILSSAIITAVGLACKSFLALGCSSVRVRGLHHLEDALVSNGNKGKGVVTVSNHISVLDDPLTWGALPTNYYGTSKMRWALGASDIMFTNPHGQVLETFRGKGIYQVAVDDAIRKLNQGGWVHLFGEGKVNQPCDYAVDAEGFAQLPRFRWGTGRILMEAEHIPVIIPMWLTGFDNVMPENRPFPRFLPRLGKNLSITFAPPLNPSKLHNLLDAWRQQALARHDAEDSSEPLGELSGHEEVVGVDDADKRLTRMELTELIRKEVEDLGRMVSGPLLGKRIPPAS